MQVRKKKETIIPKPRDYHFSHFSVYFSQYMQSLFSFMKVRSLESGGTALAQPFAEPCIPFGNFFSPHTVMWSSYYGKILYQ